MMFKFQSYFQNLNCLDLIVSSSTIDKKKLEIYIKLEIELEIYKNLEYEVKIFKIF